MIFNTFIFIGETGFKKLKTPLNIKYGNMQKEYIYNILI